jgi:hypothetical protein
MIATPVIEDILVEAREELTKALAEELPGQERQWAQTVGHALAEVEHALRQHKTSAEAPQGLLSKMDLTRPTLVRQVSGLRKEHTDLLYQVAALQAQLRAAAEAFRAQNSPLPPPGALPEPAPVAGVIDFGAIRQSADQFLSALHHHQDDEAKWILESVNTDIGVGD